MTNLTSRFSPRWMTRPPTSSPPSSAATHLECWLRSESSPVQEYAAGGRCSRARAFASSSPSSAAPFAAGRMAGTTTTTTTSSGDGPAAARGGGALGRWEGVRGPLRRTSRRRCWAASNASSPRLRHRWERRAPGTDVVKTRRNGRVCQTVPTDYTEGEGEGKDPEVGGSPTGRVSSTACA